MGKYVRDFFVREDDKALQKKHTESRIGTVSIEIIEILFRRFGPNMTIFFCFFSTFCSVLLVKGSHS